MLPEIPGMLPEVDLDQMPDSDLIPIIERYLERELERSTTSPLIRELARGDVNQKARELLKMIREQKEATVD